MEKKSTPQPQRKGYPTLAGALLSTLFNLVLLTILSWILLTAWLLVKFWTNDYSIGDEIQTILNCDLQIINHLNKRGFHYLSDIFQETQNTLNLMFHYVLDSRLASYLTTIILGSFEIILVRAWVFILMIPSFIVIEFIFVVDGLVQRDIRKFKGARESTFFFHRVKSLVGICLFSIFFIYMVVPYPISPELLLIPMILLSSLFTYLSIKNYKKYL